MALLHVGVCKAIYFSVFFGFYMLHRKKKKTVSHFDRKLKINSEDLHQSEHQSCLKYTMEGYIQKIKSDSPGFTGTQNSLVHAVLSYMAKIISAASLVCCLCKDFWSTLTLMKKPRVFFFVCFFLHCLKDISFSIWNLFEQLLKCICMRKELCIPVFKKACFMENSSGQ